MASILLTRVLLMISLGQIIDCFGPTPFRRLSLRRRAESLRISAYGTDSALNETDEEFSTVQERELEEEVDISNEDSGDVVEEKGKYIDDLYDTLTGRPSDHVLPVHSVQTSTALTEIRCYATRQLAQVCRGIAKNIDRPYQERFGSSGKPLQWRDVRKAYERPREQRWSQDKREEAKRVFIKNALLKILERRKIHPRLLMQVLDIDWDRLGAEPAAIGLVIATEKQSVVIAVSEDSYSGIDAITAHHSDHESSEGSGSGDSSISISISSSSSSSSRSTSEIRIDDDYDDGEGACDEKDLDMGMMTFRPIDMPTFLSSRWDICLSEGTSEGILSQRLLTLFDDLEEILAASTRLLRDLNKAYGARPKGSRGGRRRADGVWSSRGARGEASEDAKPERGRAGAGSSATKRWVPKSQVTKKKQENGKSHRTNRDRYDRDQGPPPRKEEVDLSWMFDTIREEESKA